MKSFYRVGAAALIACLILLSAGCFHADTSPSAPETTAPQATEPIDPSDLYANAAQEIKNAPSLSADITKDTVITVNGQAFTYQTKQSISYVGLGTEQMAAEVLETTVVGSQTIEAVDHYNNNLAYSSVNGIGFSSKMSGEAFLERYVTPVLLDASRYNSIITEYPEGKTVIRFSSPTAPEAWACHSTFRVTEASGSAVLDNNGHLESSNYSFTGSADNISISVTATVEIKTQSIQPGAQNDAITYTPVSYLDGPKLLEVATGYLLQNKSITATKNQVIHSQAFMLTRSLLTQLDMHQEGEVHNSRRSITVISSSTSPEGSDATYQQEELFKDGKYLLLVDGASQKDHENVSAESMHTYCQDLLVSTIIMPQYITGVNATEEAGKLTVHFTANDELAHILAEQACDTLYNDPALLTSLASEYTTEQMNAYLTIDLRTGFPLASGLQYTGAHTIDEFTYTLSSQQDQTYDFASQTAKQTIDALSVKDDSPTENAEAVSTPTTAAS